ncbi:hypothetical protein N7532_010454 [Penicillium argentinense]|uniref:Uncharacterized protein n=1 Tax=Penicillium argentinense TaxID=1131581 RepID=A0A9W9EPN6_9EURO|nr:uncharacterized protein N7532_010454 [Penicillium argentinense]KAJ5085683.1 hypothetical protein N7532_010454 [Penicillium argentinense]
MAFPYKKIIILGATSGIGHTLAERLIQNGSFVIAVGRRKENIDLFVQKHGPARAAGIQFDVCNLDGVQQFVANVTASHPDLDCVFLNSGIQRRSIFSEPETIDIDSIQEELTVNYTSYLALTKGFLPFFQAKSDMPTSFIFTSSNLALVPILRCSNYCASKAALHHWILCLREQLKGTRVKVVEIFPPLVETELHDAKHQPDMTKNRPQGIPVDEFADEAMQKLIAGDDQIPVGFSRIAFNGWEQQRQQAFGRVVEMMRNSAN